MRLAIDLRTGGFSSGSCLWLGFEIFVQVANKAVCPFPRPPTGTADFAFTVFLY